MATIHAAAAHVAKLIMEQIERVGKHEIIQVVTDTCSVMKAAWKIIEEKFPRITRTVRSAAPQ